CRPAPICAERKGTCMRLLVVFFAILLCLFFSAMPAMACPASSVNPSVTVCYPLANQVVSSPINVNARTTDSRAVSSLSIYLDNVAVQKTLGSQINTKISTGSGTHNLRIQAWDISGAVLQAGVNIAVGSGAPPPPPPSTLSGMFTYHNDNGRSGQNKNETIL